MEDIQIVELFFTRPEQTLEELDRKYGKLCHRLSLNILKNRQDAAACVNDACLGVWNSIPPASPGPLRAYVCKIA